MQTFDIPAGKVTDAKRRIVRANKRLKAAGIADEFTATYSPYTKVVTDATGVSRQVDRVKVTLDRPSIGYEGYSFLATVEEVAPGVFMAYSAPGVELNGWRPSTMDCEHCNKKRSRSKVYVVEDVQGVRKTVGKTCVELYTGMSPEGLFALEWDDLRKHHAEDWEKGDLTYAPLVYSTDRIIQLSAVYIKRFGYKPTSFSDSTKERVMAALNASSAAEKALVASDVAEADQVDAAYYREAMKTEFATSSTDWAMNVTGLLTLDWVEARQVGILASGVGPIVKKDEAEQKFEESGLLNEFYSYVGAQFSTAATVVKVERVVDPYAYYNSCYHRVTLHTDKGYVLVWKTAGQKVPDEGERLMFFGRVKRHNEWRGKKTTHVSRLSWFNL